MARLLTHPRSFAYLEPFIGHDRSMKQAAAVLGCRLDTLAYWVRKFLRCGLLAVTREEKRRGRPVRFYRSTAEAYFVPAEVTPYGELAERLSHYYALENRILINGFRHALRWAALEGIRIYRDRAGRIQNEVVIELGMTGKQASFGIDFAGDLYLTKQEAAKLRETLERLWIDYRARGIRSTDPTRLQYYMRISFVPMPRIE